MEYKNIKMEFKNIKLATGAKDFKIIIDNFEVKWCWELRLNLTDHYIVTKIGIPEWLVLSDDFIRKDEMRIIIRFGDVSFTCKATMVYSESVIFGNEIGPTYGEIRFSFEKFNIAPNKYESPCVG